MASEIVTQTPEIIPKPLFTDLQADDDEQDITVIESVCLQCREDGITKLMLTKIPFYKEVVVMSFYCPHCEWKNCELQNVQDIQEKGTKFTLQVKCLEDLNRQVVKSESATVIIPEVEFEVPAKTQEGAVTTIEGVISRAITGLTLRLEDDGDGKLQEFINQLMQLREVEMPFTFILDDPSGNSFVQNLMFPATDPNLEELNYLRSKTQDLDLGIISKNFEDADKELDVNGEVLEFKTNCPNCNSTNCCTNMKATKIPHFKEVIIMATTCESCGHRTNEVKSGSGIEALGTKIALKITNQEDMSRDLLKSETCDVKIPELEFEVGYYTNGGRFTTVEGLLMSITEQLAGSNSFLCGDSARPEDKTSMGEFLNKIQEIIDGTRRVTLVLDDPCGNSYLQSLDEEDSNLSVTHYQRSFQQNEELGLNDIKTENYEQNS